MRFERLPSFVLAALALALSCSPSRSGVLHPRFADGGLLAHATPLAPAVLPRFDGMYQIDGGGPLRGSVALHAVPGTAAEPGTLSIFAAADDAYAIVRGGCTLNGTQVVFEGYWRHPRTTDTGLVRLFLDQPDLAKAACAKQPPAGSAAAPSLSGATGSGNDLPGDALRVARVGDLVDLAAHKFAVAAHHGACRTIDDCGASENSLESILMVESFGAQVLEIDVRVTADGVPILYHDDNFTPRLSKGTYCHGHVADFNFANVRALCTLLYGERVPTLREALDTAYTRTGLRAVWLDVKVPEAVAPAAALANEFNARADQDKRRFRAVVGLGETALVDEFVASAPHGTPCVCELELDDVRRAGCVAWGPRWTRGPMGADVATMQSEGRAVVYWTIDEPEYIDLFLKEGRPNGVLSDRPGLVFQRFQTLQVFPAGGPQP